MGARIKKGTKSFDLALAITACAVYTVIFAHHYTTFGG